MLVLSDPKGIAHVLHSKDGVYLRDQLSRVVLADWVRTWIGFSLSLYLSLEIKFGRGLFAAEGWHCGSPD